MRDRASRARCWIVKYCVISAGPLRGQPVELTPDEVELLSRVYDPPHGGELLPLCGPLAACIALLHLAGPEHMNAPPTELQVDIFTLWSSAGEKLRQYLRRDADAVTCPALGTSWRAGSLVQTSPEPEKRTGGRGSGSAA